MNDYQRIQDLLICPACRGELTFGDQEITCATCKQAYPLHESIPLFALFTDTDSRKTERTGKSTSRYEQRYRDFERAQSYNQKYDRKLLKRLSTVREYMLLRRLLAHHGRCATMVEIPCGGGRISPQLVDGTDLLIQADVALGQVMYGMTRQPLKIPQIWMTASAFCMPFRDASVDAAVCIRLSHHLATREEREQLLAELLRISRRYVIMTFFDHNSVKNILRRMRHKKPKLTMSVAQVASLAKAHSARLVSCPRLSLIGSGHRYALLVKDRKAL